MSYGPGSRLLPLSDLARGYYRFQTLCCSHSTHSVLTAALDSSPGLQHRLRPGLLHGQECEWALGTPTPSSPGCAAGGARPIGDGRALTSVVA